MTATDRSASVLYLARLSLLLAAGPLLLSSTARGQQFAQWDANGHYYAHYTDVRLPWLEAQQFAEQQPFFGATGHLATVTSSSEWEFVRSAFELRSSPGATLLGAFQDQADPAASDPSGGWQWVTGEPWGFHRWGAGEPNDLGGGEGFLEASHGHWNDVGLDDKRTFLVEYPGPLSFLDARVNADYQIVITGTGDPVSFLRLESPRGALIPSADPAPFAAAFPNDPSRIHFAPSGGVLQIEGELVLNTRWDPTVSNDITLVYGLEGQRATKRRRLAADQYPALPEYIQHGVEPLLITVNADNHFVVTGTGQQIAGIEFTSAAGALTPSAHQTGPFPIFLANHERRVTVGVLGDPMVISGSFEFDFGPTSMDALEDISITVGYGDVPVRLDPYTLCTLCELPLVTISPNGAFETHHLPAEVTELHLSSSTVKLDDWVLPPGVQMTALTERDVVLRSHRGFGPEVLGQLHATWSASEVQSVFVSFTLPSGEQFGPLPLSFTARQVPEPQAAWWGLLAAVAFFVLGRRAA